MQCIDSAEFPAVVTYEKDTFEDDLLHIKMEGESELLVCGYHPKPPNPVSLESQELDWLRCNQIYEIIFIVTIAIVVLVHLQFIVDFLQVRIKRAYYKQTHLHTEEGEKENLESKMESDLTVSSTPFPTTATKTSTTKTSKVLNFQLLNGMTQEDYIDFERYEHFIYTHAREL
ncbi:unnamed protein product [Hymenolepis diminuta]|uniref:Ephrin RBD domain-containing protein n=1 Tax=Hymenolepis diminuta TaxID=6216 RepID=A0A0R3S8M4_HYMDI|nr:unnamed protein product [Hymenolepis diminuta]VUZ45172.1 unnamed protein product [Hymenolepis diminuta]